MPMSKKNNKRLKKFLKYLGFFILAIFIGFAALFIQTHYQVKRGDLIVWEGKMYTREEMAEIIPPQGYEAPAKNTQEEVYAELRQALLDGDIERALGKIVPEKREEHRRILLYGDQERNKRIINSLPEKITRIENEQLGNFSNYKIDVGTNNLNKLGFIKNPDGYWEIDGI